MVAYMDIFVHGKWQHIAINWQPKAGWWEVRYTDCVWRWEWKKLHPSTFHWSQLVWQNGQENGVSSVGVAGRGGEDLTGPSGLKVIPISTTTAILISLWGDTQTKKRPDWISSWKSSSLVWSWLHVIASQIYNLYMVWCPMISWQGLHGTDQKGQFCEEFLTSPLS